MGIPVGTWSKKIGEVAAFLLDLSRWRLLSDGWHPWGNRQRADDRSASPPCPTPHSSSSTAVLLTPCFKSQGYIGFPTEEKLFPWHYSAHATVCST